MKLDKNSASDQERLRRLNQNPVKVLGKYEDLVKVRGHEDPIEVLGQ